MLAVTASDHYDCEGLAGGCVLCNQVSLGRCENIFTFTMLHDFHLQSSAKGRVGDYIRVILDTQAGKYQLTSKKETKLITAMGQALDWVTCSPRTMAELDRKMVNYRFKHTSPQKKKSKDRSQLASSMH